MIRDINSKLNNIKLKWNTLKQGKPLNLCYNICLKMQKPLRMVVKITALLSELKGDSICIVFWTPIALSFLYVIVSQSRFFNFCSYNNKDFMSQFWQLGAFLVYVHYIFFDCFFIHRRIFTFFFLSLIKYLFSWFPNDKCIPPLVSFTLKFFTLQKGMFLQNSLRNGFLDLVLNVNISSQTCYNFWYLVSSLAVFQRTGFVLWASHYSWL